MARDKDAWRVYGPYRECVRGVDRYRVRLVGPTGDAEDFTTASARKARAYAEKSRARFLGVITVSEALVEYRQHLKDKGNKPTSVKMTVARLERWFPSEQTLIGISPALVRESYEKRRGEVAVDTHRNELSEVKTFLRWCVGKSMLPRSPAEEVEPIGRRRKGKPQLRRAEAMAFDRAALELAGKGDDGALAAMTVLWLGLRSGELCKLKVRDVDRLSDGTWLWIDGDVKTESSRRRLEVPADLAELLGHLAGERPGEEWLFPSWSSTGYRTKGWLKKAVWRVCDRAKVPRVPPHGLRGTHATLAEEAGTAAHIVASQLGHTSHRVTEEHYLAEGTSERGRIRRMLRVMEGGRNRAVDAEGTEQEPTEQEVTERVAVGKVR